MRHTLKLSAAALALGLFGTAAAQDYDSAGKSLYVGGSIGVSILGDSDNEGEFNSPFTVTGTALDGATLPAGTGVGWTTEFEEEFTGSLLFGMKYDPFRFEVEIARSNHDIDRHSGVYAGDIDLDPVDATVLVDTPDANNDGVQDDLGVSVGAVVLDSQGELTNTFFMLNAYSDFSLQSERFTPYVGLGIGAAQVEVDYSPSGVQLVDADETVFAYQLMAGVNAPIADRFSVFGEVSYRGTTEVETTIEPLDASLDIENRSTVLEIGLRYDLGY